LNRKGSRPSVCILTDRSHLCSVGTQTTVKAQALKAYTSAGAYSSFEENLKGQIKAGQLADIIVFSQDLFTIDPMKTYETNVVLTVFDGKVIYNVIE
jgi:predicted amidohydrolase YtcJ